MRFTDALSTLKASASNIATIAGNFATGAKPGSIGFMEFMQLLPYNAPPVADAQKLLALYNESPWVRTIVHKVSENVGKARWYLEDEASEKEVDKHPALDFLRAGNAKMNGRRTLALTQTYLDLVGEAFWVLGRDARGRLVEFAALPPHWVTDLPNQTSQVYRLQPKQGVVYDVPAEQILHIKIADPLDPYGRGKGMTHAAYLELDTDLQAATFLNSFFRNRARPDLIISGTKEAPLADRDVARAEMAWNEKFRGAGKAGRGFFSRAPLQVQEFGFGLRDNQIDKIREQQRSLISEFYNMPPELLGRLDSSNRATIDSAEYLFSKHVVVPRLEAMLDFIEPLLIENFGIKQGALCFENPTAEDTAATAQLISIRPSAFSDDEIRELAGYKALGGKHGEVAEPLPPPDPNALIPPPTGGDPKPPKEDPPKPEDAKPKAIEAPQRKSLSAADIVQVSQAHEDPFVKAQAANLFAELYKKLLDQYGAELLSELGSEVRFTVNAQVTDWLLSRSSDMIGEVDATTRDALKAALVDGVAGDEGLEALIARVDDVFAKAADYRAALIGDTEATALAGFGSYAATKQAGFERKQWLSTHDQLVRASHRDLDGKIVGLEDKFQASSGATALFPGDFGDPAEDINCRCGMRPVLPGEDESKSLARDKTLAKWQHKARDAMMTAVKRKADMLFAAQREVIVAQLKRSMGQHSI